MQPQQYQYLILPNDEYSLIKADIKELRNKNRQNSNLSAMHQNIKESELLCKYSDCSSTIP